MPVTTITLTRVDSLNVWMDGEGQIAECAESQWEDLPVHYFVPD